MRGRAQALLVLPRTLFRGPQSQCCQRPVGARWSGWAMRKVWWAGKACQPGCTARHRHTVHDQRGQQVAHGAGGCCAPEMIRAGAVVTDGCAHQFGTKNRLSPASCQAVCRAYRQLFGGPNHVLHRSVQFRIGSGRCAARRHGALACDDVGRQRVHALRQAGLPRALVTQFGRACHTGCVTGHAGLLVQLFAGVGAQSRRCGSGGSRCAGRRFARSGRCFGR